MFGLGHSVCVSIMGHSVFVVAPMCVCSGPTVFVVGHGRSEGEPVYIEDFQVYVRDVRQHITAVTADYPDVPLFIVGYSMVSVRRY